MLCLALMPHENNLPNQTVHTHTLHWQTNEKRCVVDKQELKLIETSFLFLKTIHKNVTFLLLVRLVSVKFE